MAYTATKFLSPRAFAHPRGADNTQRNVVIRGYLIENDTSTEYSVGGIGSSSFEVTAFSNVGLVTYSSLKGLPLINGQRVVIYNTASNTNDGTYIVSQLTSTTFVAVPIPGKALAGSSQTGQTAEGVGQIQFGVQALLAQTFTVSAVTVSGGIMTCTYTTLTGPQLFPGDSVTLAGMTNAGNKGTFSLIGVFPTSSTAGSFTVNNPNGVSTDSGTGTGNFQAGILDQSAGEVPTPPVHVYSPSSGWDYVWDQNNYTVRIYGTGSGANAAFAEAAVGATVTFDGNIVFEATFPRSLPH